MSQTKALREKLGEDAKVIRQMADKINAENRDFTAEEREAWEKVNASYNAGEKLLQTLQRADDIDAKMAAIGEQNKQLSRTIGGIDPARQLPSEEAKAIAFGAWARKSAGIAVSNAEREAAQLCGVNLDSNTYVIDRPVGNGLKTNQHWATNGPRDFGANMSQFNPTTGGYTMTPDSMVRSLETAMLQFGGPRQVAEVMTTATGEPLHWPAVDDTSNQGTQIGESATQTTTTTTNPSFKDKTWYAYGYTSNFILVPYGLLRDSAFNIAAIVGGMMGERVGRKTAAHFTTGDGAAKPSGIVPDSTLGVTAASATSIAADELFDLVHSIDPAYRSTGCGWMFHDNILLALRKLKDGDGQYLWQEGMSAGAPNRLLSFPYAIVQEMQSSIATATKTILFGVLSKYKIRDVGGVRMNRVNELFASTDNVGFNAISYHDGHLLDAGTHPVKHLLQA